MKNKMTAKMLLQLLDRREWTQGDLAKASGVIYSTVSDHLSGRRPIRDEHIAAYLRALDHTERPQIFSAWLHDNIDTEILGDIIDLTTGRIRESVGAWSPALDAEQKAMLRWWAGQLSRDPEIDRIFREITRKAGWPNPVDKSEIAFCITDAKGHVIHINAAFTKMCGYSLAQLRGRKPSELLQGKDTDKRTVRNFSLALRDRRPIECVLVNYHVSGAPYKVRIQCYPVFDTLGVLIQFRAVEEKLG